MTTGAKLNSADYTISLSSDKRTITASLSSSFLQYVEGDTTGRKMQYVGETYALVVKATVNTQLVGKFVNSGYTLINNKKITTNSVTATPINANLSIQKTVDQYEHKVGDTVTYTITVKNTVEGTIASNLVISDTDLPEGLQLSSASDAITVMKPSTWNNNSTGSDVATNTNVSIQKSGTGAIVTIDKLEYNQTATVTLKCVATDTVNGKETVNTASATADNASQVNNKAEVYINTASFSIDKTAERYEYEVGDEITYTVKVKNTNAGTIANNVVLQDISIPAGLTLMEDSIRMTGVPDTITRRIAGNENTPNEIQTEEVTSSIESNNANGWKASISALPYDTEVTITYTCKATEAVNGLETVNMVTVTADNASQTNDEAEVWVNTPTLEISKTAGEYEWRVGDIVDYTIKVRNSHAGTIAHNVIMSDITIPAGLTVLDVSMTGVPDTVDIPIANEDTVHGEKQTTTITQSIGEKSDNSWQANISELDYNREITIVFHCKVEEILNGMEIINTVHVTANNATEKQDNTTIWINSPVITIEKEADMNPVSVGDVITYELKMANKQTGTVARNVVIEDNIETEGVKLQKSSIVLMDSTGTVIPQSDYELTIQDNHFEIKTNRTLINSDTNYSIWDLDNSATKIDGEKWNPLGITTETSFTVEYQVKVTDKEIAGTDVINTATITCDEGTSDEATETVEINGPRLDVVKESNESIYRVGDTAHYTITVRETRENYTAKDVVVTDYLQNDKVEISQDTIKVYLNNSEVTPKSIQMNENGNGFTIETGLDITDEERIKVTYDVVLDEIDPEIILENTATAKGSNTKEANDNNQVYVDRGVNAVLKTIKTVENETSYVGGRNKYTIKVFEVRETVKAKEVVIKDTFAQEGAEYIDYTMRVKLDGVDITDECNITFEESGFKIETGQTLAIDQIIEVEYEVQYTQEAAGQTLVNTAVAVGSNTPEIPGDEAEVKVEEAKLIMDKFVEKTICNPSETNTYTLKVKQVQENVTMNHIIIEDSFLEEGATYLPETMIVYDKNGNEITENCKITYEGTSFKIETGENLSYNEGITVRYDVRYEEIADGKTMINVAMGTGTNAEGEQIQQVFDEERVKIQEVQIVTEKTANKLFRKAGETNYYTIEVKQTIEGKVAKNVVITDEFDDSQMAYVENNIKIKDTNGEDITNTCKIVYNGNGITIQTNRNLAYGEIIKVIYEAKYDESVKQGDIIINQVKAEATDENDDKIVSEAKEEVEINNEGRFAILKIAEKEICNPGDSNIYTIIAKQEGSEPLGNIVIKDSFDQEGAEYNPDSMRIYNVAGEDITENCEITYEGLGFIIKTGVTLQEGDSITVKYEVTYAETANGKIFDNTAIATGTDTSGKQITNRDDEEVKIDTIHLVTEKIAEKPVCAEGEENTYTITVTQQGEDRVYKDIVIKDSFEQEGAEYIQDSMMVKDNDGIDITEDCVITYEGKEFTIETGKELAFGESITVSYQVKYLAGTEGKILKNIAISKGIDENGNEEEGKAQEVVSVEKARLTISKKAEKEVCNVGDSNLYTIEVKSLGKMIAKDVVIEDKLSEGAIYTQDSIKIYNQDGEEIKPTVTFNGNSFTIQIEEGMAAGESVKIQYEVIYQQAASGKTIKNTATAQGSNTEEATAEGNVDEIKGAEENVKVNTKLEEIIDNLFGGGSLPKTGISIILGLAIIVAGGMATVNYIKWKKIK